MSTKALSALAAAVLAASPMLAPAAQADAHRGHGHKWSGFGHHGIAKPYKPFYRWYGFSAYSAPVHDKTCAVWSTGRKHCFKWY